MDSITHVQAELFREDTVFTCTPTTVNGWARRMALLQEELRLGDWDYDRLRVEEQKYKDIVQLNKGRTQFNSTGYKFTVLEARSVMRFLATWINRREAIERAITACEMEIRKQL